MKRRTVLKSMLSALALSSSVFAHAQDAQPIKILVGFAPGGLTDVVARLFADKLRIELGQPVIVENRPGAQGRLAGRALTQAPGDGRTFIVAPNSMPIFQEIMYPHAQRGYDFLKDWAPVATLTTYPFALVVQRDLGATTAKEFAAWVKANPKLASVGVGGAGGQGHFAAVKFAEVAGVEIMPIPYRGNGPVSVDLMGGQLPAAVLPASDFMQHRDNPKLHILGVFERERSPLAPEVPTFAEQGMDFEVGKAWMGVWTTAKTPKEDVERVQNALGRILEQAEFKEQLRSRFVMYPMFNGATEMDKLQRAEIEIWRPIIQASGFKPES